ncbi:unnamed protein product, partial [Didymodactylos carnosus]
NNITSRQQASVVTLISWSKPLNELRNARQIMEIRNGKAIRDLLNDVKMNAIIGPVSEVSVLLIKRILDRTTDMLYTQIPALAQKIEDVTNLMEQYFLSFYNIDNVKDIVQNKKKERMPIIILTVKSNPLLIFIDFSCLHNACYPSKTFYNWN